MLSIHCHFQQVWQQDMHTFSACSSGACCLCLHNQGKFLNIVAMRQMCSFKLSLRKLWYQIHFGYAYKNQGLFSRRVPARILCSSTFSVQKPFCDFLYYRYQSLYHWLRDKKDATKNTRRTQEERHKNTRRTQEE